MTTIEIPTPTTPNNPFRWESPTGTIHAGALLEMRTTCGVRIGRQANGADWKAVDHDQFLTCAHCRNRTVRDLLAGAPRPSDRQLSLYKLATELYSTSRGSTLVGKIDPDGALLLSVTEDGATTFARFGQDGKIIGDWF